MVVICSFFLDRSQQIISLQNGFAYIRFFYDLDFFIFEKILNPQLWNIGNFSDCDSDCEYWSSKESPYTEYDDTYAWAYDFYPGSQPYSEYETWKNGTFNVRAVRAF